MAKRGTEIKTLNSSGLESVPKRTRGSPIGLDLLTDITEETSPQLQVDARYDRHKKPQEFQRKDFCSFKKHKTQAVINVSDEDEDVQCTGTRSPPPPLPPTSPPLPPSSPPLDPLTICSDITTTTTTTINTTTGVKPFKFGQLSLPQQKTWMNSRRGSKTNQQKTMKVPHLKQPPSPGPVNPFKKSKNEQQLMIDAMSEANKKKTVKRQSLCHLSDDDDDDDDDFEPDSINIKKKKVAVRASKGSQLRQRASGLQRQKLSFYGGSSDKRTESPVEPGSTLENPLCLDDEESVQVNQLSHYRRYPLRSSKHSPVTPSLSSFDEWNCVDLISFVSDIIIGPIKTSPLQVEVEPESFILAVEYKTLSAKIHLKLKEIKRIDMCTSSSPMAIIIHLPNGIYKREIIKLEAKFRINNFWPIKDSLLFIKLSSKPDMISIENMENYFGGDCQKLKKIKPSEVEKLLQSMTQRYVDDDVGDANVEDDGDVIHVPVTDTRPVTRRSSRVIHVPPLSPLYPVPLLSIPNDEVVLTYKPKQSNTVLSITGLDMQCLQVGEYLNDKIINFYLMYLWDTLEEKASEVHIFSTFFFSRLTDATKDKNKSTKTPERVHVRVKSWTKNINIFEKKFILVPVCYRSHWFLAIVVSPGAYMDEEIVDPQPEPTIIVLDSMLVRRRSVMTLRSYLTQEYFGKYRSERDFSKLPVSYPSAPGQRNTYDCGVYLLTYTESLFECLKSSLPIPDGDQWAPDEKILHKRLAIQELILSLAKTNNHLEQSPSAQPTGSVQSTGSAQPNGSVRSTGSVQPNGSVQPTGSVQSTGSEKPTGSAQSTGSVAITESHPETVIDSDTESLHELENPAFMQELECENPEFSKALHMDPESSPLSKSEQSNFVVLSDSEELTCVS